MSSCDAHDVAIMRRELSASHRAGGSIVASDVRGRRHEANVAAQWITTRARKHEEAQAEGEHCNEPVYLRKHLDVGLPTMQTWIVIMRTGLYMPVVGKLPTCPGTQVPHAPAHLSSFTKSERILEPLRVVPLMVTTASRARRHERRTCRGYMRH
jgi:hypothetical protein